MKFYAYKSVKSGQFYTWHQLANSYNYSTGRYPHNEDLLMWIVEKIKDGILEEYEVSKEHYDAIVAGETL